MAAVSDLKEAKEIQIVAEANSVFSASLHTILNQTHPGNLVFSPYSLSALMAVAKLGAHGKTAEEIAKGFSFSMDDETVCGGYSKVISSLKHTQDDFTLYAANKLCCKSDCKLNADYATSVKKWFSSEFEQIDFAKKDAAQRLINSWVEKITKSKIKNLVSSGDLNPMVALVLISGVYFKGDLKVQFNSRETSKAKFYLTDKTTVEVGMMHSTGQFHYINLQDWDGHAVALPYKGDRLCMIIYLPNQKDSFSKSKMAAGLQNFNVKILDKMQPKEITLSLPRFRIESALKLVDPLSQLGMPTIFNKDKADFSGIPKTAHILHISKIIQKVLVEVSEGTATETATQDKTQLQHPTPNIAFTVDHPFMFQIVDRLTNFVLIQGNCANPAKTYLKL